MSETQYKKVPVMENEKEKVHTPEVYGYGIRHVQIFLFFMSLSLGFLIRAQLGVTIVAMTNFPITESSPDIAFNKTIVVNTNYATENNETEGSEDLQYFEPFNKTTIPDDVNFKHESNDSSLWNIYKTYNWPKSTQEMVLGSFFVGYCIMMFPTGLVVQRWGGQLPVQIALFLNGIISIGTPWLTAWGGWKALCAARVVQGMSQAGLFPAIHTLLANWVPVSERGSLSNYVYTGAGFGTIVAFQLAGILADSSWGWPSTFWITGIMCLVGLIFLTILGANKPIDHKTITQEEKSYILGYYGDYNKKKSKTPWRQILTSRHAWACFSGHIGSGVTFIFFLTQVPTYMHAILHFNIKSSGLLSSLPYIFNCFSTIAFGHFSDFCTNSNICSIKNARIISTCTGAMVTALCVVAVSYTQNASLAVALFTVMLSFHSAGHTGWMVNYIDMAPNYSGALMAFGNTLCNIVVISLPVTVSLVVTDMTNQYQWRIMFLLMAGLATASSVFYVLFMSTDVQPWNESEDANEAEAVQQEDHPEKK